MKKIRRAVNTAEINGVRLGFAKWPIWIELKEDLSVLLATSNSNSCKNQNNHGKTLNKGYGTTINILKVDDFTKGSSNQHNTVDTPNQITSPREPVKSAIQKLGSKSKSIWTNQPKEPTAMSEAKTSLTSQPISQKWKPPAYEFQ